VTITTLTIIELNNEQPANKAKKSVNLKRICKQYNPNTYRHEMPDIRFILYRYYG